jgi:hypothetical protein
MVSFGSPHKHLTMACLWKGYCSAPCSGATVSPALFVPACTLWEGKLKNYGSSPGYNACVRENQGRIVLVSSGNTKTFSSSVLVASPPSLSSEQSFDPSLRKKCHLGS